MNSTEFAQFIADNKAANPVEARIVHKVWKALKAADNRVVSVFDGEETTHVDTMAEMDAVVFNLDECYLYARTGGWVRIVLGNEWDCLVDYTLNLEDALAPVNEYIDKHN